MFRPGCSIIAAIFVSIAIGLTSTAAHGAPRAADFVGRPKVPVVALAPNGKYLALVRYGATAKDDGAILIVDLTQQEQPIAIPLRSDIRALGLRWVNNERFIFTGAAEVNLRAYVDRFRVERIRVLSIDRKGEDMTVLFEDAPPLAALFSTPSVVRLLPEKKDTVIMAASGAHADGLSLWEVNVVTGEEKFLYGGSSAVIDWYVDETGAPAFKQETNRRGTYLTTSVSGDGGKTWTEIETQVIRDLVNEPLSFQPVAPAGPGKYTVIAQRPGDDRMSILEYDIGTREFIKTVFAHPSVDVSGAVTDPFTGNYLGARFAIDKFETQLIDPKLQVVLNAVKIYFNHQASIALQGMSADGQILLLKATGPQYPGDYYLFRRDGNRLDFLFSGRPELEGRLNPVEIIQPAMSDSANITSYVTYPAGKEDAPAPLMVIPHGGPQARDYFTYDEFAQFFASRGYRVIQTNFRGSAGYGEAFVEAGHRQYGKRMHEDVIESAMSLVDRGLAEKKSMCVFGWSYGGYVATTASFMNTDMFSAAISTAGLSDLAASVIDELPSRRGSREAYAYWSSTIGDPGEDRKELESVSAAYNAEKVGMPVLLFHGEDDFVVNVDQSRKFKSALKRAGKSVEYHEFKDTGHGIVTWSEKDLEFMFNRIDQFCRSHLPS